MSSGRSNDWRSSADSFSTSKKKESPSAIASAVPDAETLDSDFNRTHDSSDSGQAQSADRPEDLSQAVSKYQSELAQKDELIAALIEELEQAVEQLDRFQRTGTNRNPVGQSASQFSQSDAVSEMQSSLMEDVRRMAEDWERSQPASALERIEAQLAAVHDLVLNLKGGRAPASTDSDDFEERVRRLNLGGEVATEAQAVEPPPEPPATNWDTIRKQYLENDSQVEEFDSRAADAEILKLISETPTPQEVNFAVATIDDLKQAIVERDAYIIQLNRLFRTRNTWSLPVDWASLANVPAEMQVRVQSLIDHLDVQVRLGEVEMSLERARLARERSQLQGEREQIQKHMRRLGLTSLAELDNISAATGTASDRRWMRFLGPNTK